MRWSPKPAYHLQRRGSYFVKHWLLKTEPSIFGIDDLAAAPRKTTSWDGVRNYQARNLIRDQINEGAIRPFSITRAARYPASPASCSVVRAAYPDPQRIRSPRRALRCRPAAPAPRWFTFDVKLVRRLKRVITLDGVARARTRLSWPAMIVLRAGNRLSVMPVEDAHWRFILSLE